MIRFEVDEAERILTIIAEDMISEADIDGALDMLESKYPGVGLRLRGGERGGVKMLFDWEKLEGWEMGAKTVGTITGKFIADAVQRVAVLADARWADEQARLADIAKHAKVRFFSPDRREDALAWLRTN
jgi:hypothetical protein